MATLTPLPLPLSFEDFCALFLLFIAYSTLGWCGEMIYCSVPKGRLCEKRGFLNGFLCPIYGHGALLVLYALRGGFRNPFLTFLFGALLTSALEYFTSWVMEKLFHMRWWDYSHYKFQINGRVCLLNSTCFGLACVLARERARALRVGADIFERRLLHSHPQLKAAREDLLAGIRARLSENETELEQLRSVYSPRRDKK